MMLASQSCATCRHWLQFARAPNAGWCGVASGERASHSGVNERVGLMTTDMQVCSQWMDAHQK